jgi:uncharacterized protein YecT (DUF1311 family)
MIKRDQTREILEIKGRKLYFGYLSSRMEGLIGQFAEKRSIGEGLADFYPIRAVTILEVFTRAHVGSLIDHAKRYRDNAVQLTNNLKIDFSMGWEVQDRVITLGDIVAHSIPTTAFVQILGHFEAILDKKLRPLLTSAVDRVRIEIYQEPPQPIIPDYDSMVKSLIRLFEIRHVLCHEMPAKPVYEVSELEGLLKDASHFMKAMGEVLTFEKYGLVPLTQAAMNRAEAARLTELEEQLDRLTATIRSALKTSDDSMEALNLPDIHGGWQSCFDQVQGRWMEFRNADCDFITHLNRGGTIRPLLWASQACKLTEERIAALEDWIKVESSRLTIFDSYPSESR